MKEAKPFTDPKGFVWHQYCCEFVSPDGRFGFYLYAISDEHAELQMQAVRETGCLTGRLLGTVGAE